MSSDPTNIINTLSSLIVESILLLCYSSMKKVDGRAMTNSLMFTNTATFVKKGKWVLKLQNNWLTFSIIASSNQSFLDPIGDLEL